MKKKISRSPMLSSWHIWGLINNSKWAFKMKIKHRGKGYRKMFRMCWGKTVRIERRGFHAFHPVISLPLLAVRSTETQESLLWAPGTNRGLTVSREHQASRHDPSLSTSTIWVIHFTPQWLFIHIHHHFVMTFTGIISSPFRRLKSVRAYTTTTTHSPNSGY